MTSLSKPREKRECKRRVSLQPSVFAIRPGDICQADKPVLHSQDKGTPCQLLLPLTAQSTYSLCCTFWPKVIFKSALWYIVFLSSIGFIEVLKAQRLYKLPEDWDLAVAFLCEFLIASSGKSFEWKRNDPRPKPDLEEFNPYLQRAYSFVATV